MPLIVVVYSPCDYNLKLVLKITPWQAEVIAKIGLYSIIRLTEEETI